LYFCFVGISRETTPNKVKKVKKSYFRSDFLVTTYYLFLVTNLVMTERHLSQAHKEKISRGQKARYQRETAEQRAQRIEVNRKWWREHIIII